MSSLLTGPRFMLVGGGTAARAAEVLGRMGVRRPLVVTDPALAGGDMLRRVLAPMQDTGACVQVFHDGAGEPTDEAVRRGVAVLQAGDFDGVVAFGGGSVMDVAKAMLLLYGGGGPLRRWALPQAADLRVLPLLCIPTTAGTGSEVSRFAVIIDQGSGERLILAGLGCVPEGAIIDWELTLDLPRRQTIDGGLNALTHALEAYVSRRATPVSDALALSALRLIGKALPRVVKSPGDAHAREDMMTAAMEAGLAYSDASHGLVDGMSRAMALFFRVPQGLGSAMLLPAVTSFSLAAAPERYAEAARAMGVAHEQDDDDVAGAKLVGWLRRLCTDLEVPSPRAFGISEDAFMEALAGMADAAVPPGLVPDPAHLPTAEQIQALYRQSFG
ncbi:iron-containing alcohol dehydrogenase [Caenispirillum bisanense]|uniref:iron-containing alcohol dehydrogenase n=1 Tax=Caenispirillum bisanense TaxID=414052 RepID=UPI0031DF102E